MFFLSGLDEIKLNSTETDDPQINLDFEKLHSHKIEHLRGWFLFRSDFLRGIQTVRDIQLK